MSNSLRVKVFFGVEETENLKRGVRPSKSFWKGLSIEKKKFCYTSQQTTLPQGEEM